MVYPIPRNIAISSAAFSSQSQTKVLIKKVNGDILRSDSNARDDYHVNKESGNK